MLRDPVNEIGAVKGNVEAYRLRTVRPRVGVAAKVLLPILVIFLGPQLLEIEQPVRVEREDGLAPRSSATDDDLEGIVAEDALEAVCEVEGGGGRAI